MLRPLFYEFETDARAFGDRPVRAEPACRVRRRAGRTQAFRVPAAGPAEVQFEMITDARTIRLTVRKQGRYAVRDDLRRDVAGRTSTRRTGFERRAIRRSMTTHTAVSNSVEVGFANQRSRRGFAD
jgi:hypothetical protein